VSQESLISLEAADCFPRRHIGPSADEQQSMLEVLGYESARALAEAALPASILAQKGLDLPPARTEAAVAQELRSLAARNAPQVPMIGLGYYGTVTPAVIRRNVLENPSWYTAYTPYQPEISQGRLEALLNFQTMIGDLTGLPTANASLLDEATAAAEAMTLVRRANRSNKSDRFLVDRDCLPQTITVLQTRAHSLGIRVEVLDVYTDLPADDFAGVLVAYPGASGQLADPRPVIEAAHEAGALAVVAADLLALTLVQAPGQMGADVVVGTTQRFGVPLFYGTAGVPTRPADPRAAHPPGQGDVEHLHGPGTARGHGLYVRRLPRPGRPASHRISGGALRQSAG
jgi:glycine cleavage system P protein (glycine dehydrogenase)